MIRSAVEFFAGGGRMLQRLWKPKFDPQRPERVYREFDAQRGFAASDGGISNQCNSTHPAHRNASPGSRNALRLRLAIQRYRQDLRAIVFGPMPDKSRTSI